MRVFHPKYDFNAQSVVLHQYDKALNMLAYLGKMQEWYDGNVKEFWEGTPTTLMQTEKPVASVEELHQIAQSWYDEGKCVSIHTDEPSLKTVSAPHIGEMYAIDNDTILKRCHKGENNETIEEIVATGSSEISEWYKNHPEVPAYDSGEDTWLEIEESKTYWAWDGTEWLKMPSWDNTKVNGWYLDVMNIETCSEFGLSLWAKMVGVVLPEYDMDISDIGQEVAYYFNKISVWRNFIKASFFRLTSNGSLADINRYFYMIFGKLRGGTIEIEDGGLIGEQEDVMTVTYMVNFKASIAQEAFLNIGSPNQAMEGIFPHPAGVLAKCIIGAYTGDDETDWRLGLNEHNLMSNNEGTGSDPDEFSNPNYTDADWNADVEARITKEVKGQNLQNLNFFEDEVADKYEEFSTTKSYKRGDVVKYNEQLYMFIKVHSAGEWNGIEVLPINHLRNGGYFAGDENVDYLGLNERKTTDFDDSTGTYTGTAESDQANLGGQDIENFDHGVLSPYDESGEEPEVGPFLGLGDQGTYTNDDYKIPEFSTTTAYSVSDKVVYKGKTYIFKTSHIGVWNATEVELVDQTYDRGPLDNSLLQ